MKVLRSIPELKAWRRGVTGSVGFVPTMGALHAGHRSLLTAARAQNDSVVLSIFVNPAQFNQAQDLEKYPRTESADLAMATACGVDAVFMPSDPDEIYPDGYHYRMSEDELSAKFCGEFRPGHFDGVLSVVLKLFLLVMPRRAYFGTKDFQQLLLVEGMVRAYFLDVEVVRCPTVREADGLALSSRNSRLTPKDREKAPLIYRTLGDSSSPEEATTRLEAEGFQVEYLKEVDGRRWVAAWLGDVRLIDNVAL